MRKKLLSLLVAITIMATSVFMLTGCKKEAVEEVTRMTFDVNPSIELILDEEKKVVSVTALNDDASLILAGEVLVGKTAEEATEILVSLCVDTGYLTEGKNTENKVSISISGDSKHAEKFKKEIKETVEQKLEDLDIEASIEQVEALALDALKSLVEENSMYTNEEVAAMSEEELYNAIKLSRIETAELVSAELREVYFAMKESEIKFAEKEFTAEAINALGGIYSIMYNTYKAAVDQYHEAINSINEFKYNTFVKEDSDYQQALKRLRDAKVELLKQQKLVFSLEVNTDEYQIAINNLTLLENAYDQAVLAFEQLGTLAQNSLDRLVAAMTSAEAILTNIEAQFPENITDTLNEKASDLETLLNTKKDEFFAAFEAEYQDDIDALAAELAAQKAELIANNK